MILSFIIGLAVGVVGSALIVHYAEKSLRETRKAQRNELWQLRGELQSIRLRRHEASKQAAVTRRANRAASPAPTSVVIETPGFDALTTGDEGAE